MMNNNFDISIKNNTIILSKDNKSFSISKIDDSIIFKTDANFLRFDFCINSIDELESEVYLVFETFIKLVVGKKILSSLDKSSFNVLPNNFVNLNTRIISFDSDENIDGNLSFQYTNTKITVFIRNNYFKINFDNKKYETYYQDLDRLYNELSFFVNQVSLIEKNGKDVKKLLTKILHNKLSS